MILVSCSQTLFFSLCNTSSDSTRQDGRQQVSRPSIFRHGRVHEDKCHSDAILGSSPSVSVQNSTFFMTSVLWPNSESTKLKGLTSRRVLSVWTEMCPKHLMWNWQRKYWTKNVLEKKTSWRAKNELSVNILFSKVLKQAPYSKGLEVWSYPFFQKSTFQNLHNLIW